MHRYKLMPHALYAIYAVTYLIAFLLYYCLHGVDLVGQDVATLYAINVGCIFLTLAACCLLPQLHNWPWLQRAVNASGLATVQEVKGRLACIKVILFGLILLVNTTAYCLAAYAQAPKYTTLIALLLGVLIWPKLDSLPSKSSAS